MTAPTRHYLATAEDLTGKGTWDLAVHECDQAWVPTGRSLFGGTVQATEDSIGQVADARLARAGWRRSTDWWHHRMWLAEVVSTTAGESFDPGPGPRHD